MAQPTEKRISNDQLRLGGLLLAGLAAGLALPKILPLARQSVKGLGGMTYRSGPADSSVRPSADPARGRPA